MLTLRTCCLGFIVGLVLLLGGCGHQGQSESDSATRNTTIPGRSFPADTLYSLLVAEVAVNRGQLDIALANYYQQAYKTRDAGVARRATMLAGYLQADQAALDLAQLWSSIEPENPEPLYISGQYFIDSNRLDLALQQAKRLLALHATPLFLAITTNPAALEDKNRQWLTQEYSALLQTNPDNNDLLLGYAALLSANEQYDESQSLIAKVLVHDEKNLPARLLQVDVSYKSGRPDTAIHLMEKIVNDDPDNDKLRMEYAQLLSEKDLKKAREQFDYMAQRNSMDPTLLLARALVNYRLKDYAQAQDFFEQLLFLKKMTDTAHFYLGEIALSKNKIDKALEHYRRVDEGDEFLPATERALSLLIKQNRLPEARKWLAEQRKQHPDAALPLYLLEANTLFQHGDELHSLSILNEAIQHYPNKVHLYMARSLLYQRQGDNNAAETDLRTVLSGEPDNAEALNALGYLLADSNRQLNEAKKLLEHALALQPQDPAILDSMGWLLFRMGEKEEAILRLKKSFALHPDDEVAAHLGEVLWLTDQKAAAQQAWEEGLRLKSDSKIIRSTRQRLGAH